ncbi:hypothetical protein [Desulfovibrio sp. JC010]|uniref:hypothetical protein n=1 Tax=Desulfovibrio sp. JC010 TaxID=2593641 RepID=UPI0013D08CDA|nr:hypothetical protein [Desulfovibrio sp. JC010]NDV27187.1 hypothetical protein [Desulfovibrio sp. JC010]
MKKITVLFTVLMLLAATSAWADVVFPKSLNGTYSIDAAQKTVNTDDWTANLRVFTGFTANASLGDADDGSFNSTFIPFNASHVKIFSVTSEVIDGNGPGGNSSVSADFGFFNSTDEAAIANVIGVIHQNNGSADFQSENATSFNLNNRRMSAVTTEPGYKISGLTMMSNVNATLDAAAKVGETPFYFPVNFISTAGAKLMAGLGNATLAGGGATYDQSADVEGSTFMLSYQNGTVTNCVFDNTTWSYYVVGYDYGTEQETFYGVGQVKFNSAPTALDTAPTTYNAQAKVVYYNDDRSEEADRTDKWYHYNATSPDAAAGLIEIDGDGAGGSFNLMQYGVLNKDRNMISGIVYNLVDGNALNARPVRAYAIMIKDSKSIATSDLQNRGYKMVYAGWGEDHGSKNATQGIMAMNFDSNLSIIDGGLVYNEADTATSGDEMQQRQVHLNGYSAAVASTGQFKSLTQSNMTITSSDGSSLAGNFYGRFATDKDYAVGIYEPAGTDGERSAFGLAVLIPDTALVSEAATAGSTYQTNGTAAFNNLLVAAGNVITPNSTDYTLSEIRERWTSVPSSFIPVTPAIGFNSTLGDMTANMLATNTNKLYMTFQFTIQGVSGKISTLALYKLMVDSANSHALTYASSADAAKGTNGAWWISDAPTTGYKGSNSELDAGTTYYVNYVIESQGTLDAKNDGSVGQFIDPVVLGSIAGSSSSSSGCVFNPAAGFGLEWLLLMVAPLVAVVRSRFKK